MDFIDRLGPARASLEGVGRLAAANGDAGSGVFRFVQQQGGQPFLAVRSATDLPFHDSLSFTGTTTENPPRVISARGFVANWQVRPDLLGGRSSDVLMLCTDVLVTPPSLPAVPPGARPRRGRIVLANYFGSTKSLAFRGAKVTLGATANFKQLQEIYQRVGGFHETHDVEFVDLPVDFSKNLHGFAIQITDALTLESGASVSHYQITVPSPLGEPPTDLYHWTEARHRTLRPFPSGPLVSAQALLKKLELSTGVGLGRFHENVAYYVDACDLDASVESRALAAATLIDSLGQDLVIPAQEAAVDSEVLKRASADALEAFRGSLVAHGTAGPEVDLTVDRARGLLSQLSRPSYSKWLEAVMSEHGVLPDAKARKEWALLVSGIRHQLVHNRRFMDTPRPSAQWQALNWTACALLSRSVGVTDGFQSLPPEIEQMLDLPQPTVDGPEVQ